MKFGASLKRPYYILHTWPIKVLKLTYPELTRNVYIPTYSKKKCPLLQQKHEKGVEIN